MPGGADLLAGLTDLGVSQNDLRAMLAASTHDAAAAMHAELLRRATGVRATLERYWTPVQRARADEAFAWLRDDIAVNENEASRTGFAITFRWLVTM